MNGLSETNLVIVILGVSGVAVMAILGVVLITVFGKRDRSKVTLTELPPARIGQVRCCSPCCHDHTPTHTSTDLIDLAPLPQGAVSVPLDKDDVEEVYPFRVVKIGDEIEIVHPDGDLDGMAWVGDDAQSAIEYAQSLSHAFVAGVRARDDVFGRLAAGEIVEPITLSGGMAAVIRLRRAFEDLDRKRVH